VQALEEQHSAEQRARARLEEVPGAVAEPVAPTTYLDDGPVHAQRRLDERREVDQQCGQVRAEVRPGLQLSFVAVLDVLDHVGGGEEDRLGNASARISAPK
jgi:hypothetical protein